VFHLNGIQQQATFFVVLGYSREKILAQLNASFPGEDAEAAYDAAIAQHEESERQLDVAVRKADLRAQRAEHDLTVSMHDA